MTVNFKYNWNNTSREIRNMQFIVQKWKKERRMMKRYILILVVIKDNERPKEIMAFLKIAYINFAKNIQKL